MFNKSHRKLKRISEFVAVLSKYGFKDILARMNMPVLSSVEDAATGSEYTRIRKVLEELGPAFIKLGQTLSNRDDLLPRGMVEELQLLQDKVDSAPLNIHSILEDNFGVDYTSHFLSIDTTPIAAASIAQIFRATLKDGESVVLKVKHPDIEQRIETDLMLMKDVAQLLTTYFEFADNINLIQAVNAFERSLLTELSFVNERENLERLSQNFKHDKTIYVPRVYTHLSNNEVLCMEFIDGAKITDVAFHQLHGLNANELAQNGLQLYLKQIIDHGFFHADPHAGNIMVLKDGRIVFIDLGAMGEIYHADRLLLEDLVLHMVAQNPAKLVEMLKKMAIRIDVRDERKLHNDIAGILNLVNSVSLEEIKVTVIIDKFKEILFENRIVMPDYFMLLVRGIILIESVGRTLNPEMNIIKSIEPFIAGVIKKRISPEYLIKKGLSLLGELREDAQNVPMEMRQTLKKLHQGNLKIQVENHEMHSLGKTIEKSISNLMLALLIAALIIATSIISASDSKIAASGSAVLPMLGLTFGLTIYLIIRVLRR